MKTSIIFLSTSLLLLANLASAQDVSVKERFKLFAPITTFVTTKGQSDTVELSVLRSKYFRGPASMKLNPIPYGVSASIIAKPDQDDKYYLVFSIDNSFDLNEFNLLPACTIGGKTKAVAIKISVSQNLISNRHEPK